MSASDEDSGNETDKSVLDETVSSISEEEDIGHDEVLGSIIEYPDIMEGISSEEDSDDD